MIKALITDFSGVLLFPTDDSYSGGLNDLHEKLSELADYDFWKHFRLNEDLLSFLRTLGEKVNLYVFTTGRIQDHPVLQPKLNGVFKKIFSGGDLGLKKTDPKSYEALAREIHLKPEEILYIDDKQENLDAAKKAGFGVVHFESNEVVVKDLGELGVEV